MSLGGVDVAGAARRVRNGTRSWSSACARSRSSSRPTGCRREVEVVEELGADAYVFCVAQIAGEDDEARRARADGGAPQQGERVHLRPAGDEAHLFDPETGVRLS